MIQGFDPRTGQAVGDAIAASTPADIAVICARAADAFRVWSATSREMRADVLERIADALDAETPALAAIADRETALGLPRLTGELKRTSNQLRLFAGVLREGSYLEATLDSADATTVPPRPELRRMLQALGPVAVFAASNFPFAFSVAGGDTASALAAGCTVVVKAHEAHPGTSRATAEVVARALAAAGAPPGVFDIAYGPEAGKALVQHPAIKAVGFTGSTGGGRALYDFANARPDPIPFYGELGSINPVVVLPGIAHERSEDITAGYATSLTLGVGQFCTNPGLMFVPASLVDALAAAVELTRGGPMLTTRMRDHYDAATAGLAHHARLAAQGSAEDPGVQPRLFVVDLRTFAADLPRYTEECFGPAGVVVTYDDIAAVEALIPALPGTLTASVHATEAEGAAARRLARAFARISGRVIYNAWQTGVAVAWGMQHGGPWPASTNALHTSVGATSIRRWLAPVSFQGWPDALLPAELQDANPHRIPRRRDGILGTR